MTHDSPPKTAPVTYADAGVDIDRANRTKQRIKYLAHKTFTKSVLSEIGGFGGLFSVPLKYRDPVLVSSVDGVGTKLKVAFEMKVHHTVGGDLVNHCVNDIAVLGAEPLFFLDYIGTGKLEPRVFTDIIKGFAKACAENRCALIGGETAQMPGFYQPGEYDVSGTIVGVVEKSRMLNGKSIRPGDAVIGLASSGLHTNGYSLARKIFFEELKWKPEKRVPELQNTIGSELLSVHVSYGPLIQEILRKYHPASRTSNRSPSRFGNVIKAAAHITGGGFVDNIPRTLPANCDALIWRRSWDVLPIFELIQQLGGVPQAELYQVFNMGIGMTLIVAADRADSVLQFIRSRKQKAWVIGEVTRGSGVVQLK